MPSLHSTVSVPSSQTPTSSASTNSLLEALPIFAQAQHPPDKVILARVDLNIPLATNSDSAIAEPLSYARIDAVRSLIELASPNPLVLCSHLGRPKGTVKPELSLQRLIPHLEKRWQRKVIFLGDSQKDGALEAEALASLKIQPENKTTKAPAKAAIGLFENLRFHKGEEQNDQTFAAKLAAKADIYINDAFSICHRKHASTCAITKLLPAYAGCELVRELAMLLPLIAENATPTHENNIAILGGSKVSTKIDLLRFLIQRCSTICLGGNMANCFLAARGLIDTTAFSACEIKSAREIDAIVYSNKSSNESSGGALASSCNILLPCDVALAPDCSKNLSQKENTREEVVVQNAKGSSKHSLWDIGERSCYAIESVLEQVSKKAIGSTRVIVNGPLGVFEKPPYDRSTLRIMRFLAKMTKQGLVRTICGGGDTIAILERAGVVDDFTHVSLGGGAFLELLTAKELPSLRALRLSKQKSAASIDTHG